MKASEFDTKFDEGEESVLKNLDLKQARRPGIEQKRVNIDFPVWMVNALDCEAKRLGVTRQSVIKIWLAEKLETIVRN
ncbi:MAG: BrnA antitoxin family protein [Anaerolineaceae bacterium]|nr:BrnA antitoxin family protein [Anaerolineaceae bacterium]